MNENIRKSDVTPCFTDSMLLELAKDLRKKSYAPYSGYTVGAACIAESGTTYFGCNVENSSYPAGICAERVAISCAIAHGEQKIELLALAGGINSEQPDGRIRPCGLCLQFLSEFMVPDGRILIADGINSRIELKLSDLLPHAFTLRHEADREL